MHGLDRSAELLDYIKATGFKYSTLGAVTVSIDDAKVPERKKEILEKAQQDVAGVLKQYKRGLITEEERYNSVIKIWEKATDDVKNAMKENFEKQNPFFIMSDSGARRKPRPIKANSRNAWTYGKYNRKNSRNTNKIIIP